MCFPLKLVFTFSLEEEKGRPSLFASFSAVVASHEHQTHLLYLIPPFLGERFNVLVQDKMGLLSSSAVYI
jgi:hypothetical protein